MTSTSRPASASRTAAASAGDKSNIADGTLVGSMLSVGVGKLGTSSGSKFLLNGETTEGALESATEAAAEEDAKDGGSGIGPDIGMVFGKITDSARVAGGCFGSKGSA